MLTVGTVRNPVKPSKNQTLYPKRGGTLYTCSESIRSSQITKIGWWSNLRHLMRGYAGLNARYGERAQAVRGAVFNLRI